MDRFWICIVEGDTIGIQLQYHTFAVAKKEAERLAECTDYAGCTIHIIGLVASYQVSRRWVEPGEEISRTDAESEK